MQPQKQTRIKITSGFRGIIPELEISWLIQRLGVIAFLSADSLNSSLRSQWKRTILCALESGMCSGRKNELASMKEEATYTVWYWEGLIDRT